MTSASEWQIVSRLHSNLDGLCRAIIHGVTQQPSECSPICWIDVHREGLPLDSNQRNVQGFTRHTIRFRNDAKLV